MNRGLIWQNTRAIITFSEILLVKESNVSSELNSDFSVTITTQEEGHYQPFIICKTCVYLKLQNE